MRGLDVQPLFAALGFYPSVKVPSSWEDKKSHLHFVATQNKKDKEFDGAQARSKERDKTRRTRLLKGA